MVFSRHHSWGRRRASYVPWGGYYQGGGWLPRPTVVQVGASNAVDDKSDNILIGGAVALGVVALVAIVYGATRKA